MFELNCTGYPNVPIQIYQALYTFCFSKKHTFNSCYCFPSGSSRRDSDIESLVSNDHTPLINFKSKDIKATKQQFVDFITLAGTEKYQRKGKDS